MTSPQPIEIDHDQAGSAATALKDCATRMDGLATKFADVVAAFKVDASLDGDVMPASKATLDLLTQATRTVKTNLSAIVDKVNHTGDLINDRVATSRSGEAQSAATVQSIAADAPK